MIKARLPSGFFFYPREERGPILERFGEIHYKRMRYLVPLLILLSFFLLATDFAGIEIFKTFPLYQWYIWCDLGFLALQIAYLFALRRSGRVRIDRRAVFLYALLALVWAALVSALEFRQTGSITTIIIATMAMAMLGLFSFFSVCFLVATAIAVFLGAAFFLPGGIGPTPDRLIFLFALSLVSILISRTLFAAFVENILTTRRLAAANEELNAAQLSLIRKEKFATIGQLSAGIAHEINNPLGFIKSNVSALEQGFRYLRVRGENGAADAARAEFFENIEKLFDDTRDGFRRISEVIENLRYFAYEQPPGIYGPYDLNQGIERSLVVARHSYKGIARIETKFGELPLIEARGSEINQVLLNLMINAIKAIESAVTRKEGLITMTTRAGETSVCCDISDSGPGVAPKDLPRLFEPFFTTKAAGEGMGLGLSLSYEIIVNRHHGSLALLDGLPTTFRICLPIRQAAGG